MKHSSILILATAIVFNFQFSIVNSLSAQTTEPDAEYNLIRRTYKVNADGSMDIRIRKEIKLLRNRAITAYADKGETFIEYNPAFESLTINESYTQRPDGTKVQTPQNAFINQLPSSCVDCGRYNGIREMAIVHTALEYNCIVVLDYTLHRNSGVLAERFNTSTDCPVKRYEITYPDGHKQVLTDIPQTLNDPYMPAKQGYDVEFQIGAIPQYTAESGIPEARKVVNGLKKEDAKASIAAIRDWVVDYVVLNPINPARVNYAITPAAQVFQQNCGTAIDKRALMDTDEALAAAEDKPVYIDRKLEWKPDTLVDGYFRITLPVEKEVFNINPAFLPPSRKSDVQATAAPQFIHYTMELPKGTNLLGDEVDVEYTLPEVGSINIIVKQKKNRLLITRSLRLRKAVITQKDYNDFRRLMIDWNSFKELLFKAK
ncbi:MAG: DUF3857 domain-containing protein [Bacteroidales bacterium]|nr:DUF3857 domain-containing protein [Bacteroidales bacterium]